MTERIEPALTPEEWNDLRSSTGGYVNRGGAYGRYLTRNFARIGGGDDDGFIEITPDEAPLVIALANAALPDSDPRKITRAWVRDLRTAQIEVQGAAVRACSDGQFGRPCDECQEAVNVFKARLQEMADALEAYLPPE